MKNIFKSIFLSGVILCVASCNFLDMDPTDRVSDKVMWESTENAEYHVNYLYTYVYDVLMSQCSAGLTEALTDQLKYGSYNYNAMCYIPSEIAYGDGTTLTAGYVDAYLGYWGSWYQGIMKTNNAISNLRAFGQMSEEDKIRLEGEIRFIRAYLYFDLMKRYKEIIIYDERMEEYRKDKELSTEEDGWEFIYNDLKYAGEVLPDRTKSGGRIDKGMAWALMSRAMLYAKQYERVVEAADKVTELGYRLEAEYKDSYSKSIAAGKPRKAARGGKMAKSMPYRLLSLICFVLIIVFWCVASYGHLVKEVFLPSPTAVLSKLFSMAADGSLWIVYHANLVSGSGWGGRSVWTQQVEWQGDSLVLGSPASPSVEHKLPIASYSRDNISLKD
jgi:hypothetical protein